MKIMKHTHTKKTTKYDLFIAKRKLIDTIPKEAQTLDLTIQRLWIDYLKYPQRVKENYENKELRKPRE